eukprot:6490551-Amphidinium_carterae.2
MDCDFSSKNRQVMSPTPEANQLGRAAQRSVTPRTRKSVHRGRYEYDDQVMALEGQAETFSLETISSFEVLQQQLDVLSQEQHQQVQGLSRTIAPRSKLRMTAEGSEDMNLRRRVDLLTLELEKAQFETKTD